MIDPGFITCNYFFKTMWFTCIIFLFITNPTLFLLVSEQIVYPVRSDLTYSQVVHVTSSTTHLTNECHYILLSFERYNVHLPQLTFSESQRSFPSKQKSAYPLEGHKTTYPLANCSIFQGTLPINVLRSNMNFCLRKPELCSSLTIYSLFRDFILL
jgi:hypothetical protein